MAGDSRLERFWRPLVGDLRQAVVGWLVLLGLPLVAAVLLASLAGQIPAWSLAVTFVIAAAAVAAILVEYRRELGRVEGLLRAEKERRTELGQKLADAQQSWDSTRGEGSHRGLLFRVQALRSEIDELCRHGRTTSSLQERTLHHLALDVREQCGASTTLDAIANYWQSPPYDTSADDAATALGQLEGIVIGADHESQR